MAQGDYLSGSKFGQVAGGLLARRGKQDKKQFEQALLLSAILETFGQFQAKQKQDTNDAVLEIQDKYSDIFENNEALYNLQQANRSKYLAYQNDPKSYLDTEEMTLFNNDPNIKASGLRYDNIFDLDEESKKKALAIVANKRKEAEDFINKIKENPAVSMPTLTQFNKAAKDEYKAALAQVQDDPARQGVIKSAFNKLFGYGASDQAELEAALENAKRLREVQENQVSPRETIEGQEKQQLQTLVKENKEAALNIKVNNPEFYDFTTKEEALKLAKDNFVKKINTAGYEYTLEDLNKAGEYGVQLPGLPGFNQIMIENRPTLINAFKQARIAQADGQHPLEVLNGSEALFYAMATGADINQYKSQKIQRELNELRLEKLRNPDIENLDISSVMSELTNKEYRATIEKKIQTFAQNLGDDMFNMYNKLPLVDQKSLASNVIITMDSLRREKPSFSKGTGAFDRLVQAAMEIQFAGIYDTGEKTWAGLGGPRFGYQSVDTRDYNLIDKDITNDYEADQLVNALNTKKYLQQFKIEVPNSDDTMSLIPNETGKEFLDTKYRYYVVQVDPEDPTSLRWTWEYRNN